ncbi:MAG TPA: hypothetical protein VGC15_07205 [Acetobacteraceae bacterium]
MEKNSNASYPQPATFAERGVAMPFTSPALTGMRVRSGQSQLELVLPNPSGARGTYVVPWAAVPDMCQPTLHDLRLLATLDTRSGEREVIGPARVHAAARHVALEGTAGRQARAAAEAAMAADKTRMAATAQYVVSVLAFVGTGCPDAQEAAALARVVAELGIGPGAADAPVPKAIAALGRLQVELLSWAGKHPEDTGPARLVAALAANAAACAGVALAAARHSSPAALMLAWRAGPGRVAALATRPVWILDGWQLPALLWAAAAPGSSAALTEAAQVAPLLPPEAEAWTGLPTDTAAADLLRRVLAGRAGDARAVEGRGPDVRAALASDMVERNEQLRGMAA